MEVKVNGKVMDLSERLIENTSKLLENNSCDKGYNKLIDYNRELFRELYDLDIFCFIDKDIVKEYGGGCDDE